MSKAENKEGKFYGLQTAKSKSMLLKLKHASDQPKKEPERFGDFVEVKIIFFFSNRINI